VALVLVTVWNVPSPRKKVVLLAVPPPNLPEVIMPVRLPAGILVKLAALIAGKEPVKFAAGRDVKFAPEPECAPTNVVAVIFPVTLAIPAMVIVEPPPTGLILLTFSILMSLNFNHVH